MRRPHAPRALPVIAALLIVLGFVASRVIPAVATEQQLATNVLLSAIPFILIFVGILLFYITLIVLVASSLNGVVSQRAHRIVTLFVIGGILLGILGMFQAVAMVFYTYGFVVLLYSTLAYILWSHVTPAFEDVQEEERGGVAVH
ncbi:MAG TPA: hypothetical protein VL334_09265 [Anaerolineae bacterium]|nr:hypothetical protein [Anaerolineae bacterium]